MSVESAEQRKRKCIVELVIEGFKSASDAITFANTVELILKDKGLSFKFKKYLGSPDTTLAITPDYSGDSILKIMFLELTEYNDASFVCDEVRKAMSSSNEVNKHSLNVLNETRREKPQPQFIG